MDKEHSSKPRLGISACLPGQKVRFDGAHKQDHFLTDTFGRFVELVAVCPELEVGMGVPRESVRLVGPVDKPKLIAERSGKDWTDAMQRHAAVRLRELAELKLSGYVFRKNSPSCGVERVRVYNAKNTPARSQPARSWSFTRRINFCCWHTASCTIASSAAWSPI